MSHILNSDLVLLFKMKFLNFVWTLSFHFLQKTFYLYFPFYCLSHQNSGYFLTGSDGLCVLMMPLSVVMMPFSLK